MNLVFRATKIAAIILMIFALLILFKPVTLIATVMALPFAAVGLDVYFNASGSVPGPVLPYLNALGYALDFTLVGILSWLFTYLVLSIKSRYRETVGPAAVERTR